MKTRAEYDAHDRATIARMLRRIRRARRFPYNTDPCVRHVQMMGESLSQFGRYPMLTEDPLHCAVSLLATVEALYKARNEIDRLKAAQVEAEVEEAEREFRLNASR